MKNDLKLFVHTVKSVAAFIELNKDKYCKELVNLKKEGIMNFENPFMIIDSVILNKIFKLKNKEDTLMLYFLYYTQAKQQKTNSPHATVSFCAKELNWGINKIRTAKKSLIELNLIKEIPAYGKNKAYIKINY